MKKLLSIFCFTLMSCGDGNGAIESRKPHFSSTLVPLMDMIYERPYISAFGEAMIPPKAHWCECIPATAYTECAIVDVVDRNYVLMAKTFVTDFKSNEPISVYLFCYGKQR